MLYDMNQDALYTRAELIDYIKPLAATAKQMGIDKLTSNTLDAKANVNAESIADYIAYAMDSQPWITPETEPALDEVRTYAIAVDNDYTDQQMWHELIQSIEQL